MRLNELNVNENKSRQKNNSIFSTLFDTFILLAVNPEFIHSFNSVTCSRFPTGNTGIHCRPEGGRSHYLSAWSEHTLFAQIEFPLFRGI